MNSRLAPYVLTGALLLLLAPTTATARADRCDYDPQPFLAMDPHRFDQAPDGWRRFADGHCERVIGDLIAAYRARHQASLTPAQISDLDWHEGQVRAVVGDYARAIPLFERTRRHDPYPADELYRDATLAFLRRDRLALLDVRRRLAALPEPPGHAAAAARAQAEHGFRPAWPLGLDVVDRLIACFDRSYAEAYLRCSTTSVVKR